MGFFRLEASLPKSTQCSACMSSFEVISGMEGATLKVSERPVISRWAAAWGPRQKAIPS